MTPLDASPVNWDHTLTIVGLALISIGTRGFFLFPRRDIALPAWLRQGLRYAPLAALVAVVVPEVLVFQGQLVHTWQDPRLFAAAAGAACYLWRRGMLSTIVVGMTALWALQFGLGWR